MGESKKQGDAPAENAEPVKIVGTKPKFIKDNPHKNKTFKTATTVHEAKAYVPTKLKRPPKKEEPKKEEPPKKKKLLDYINKDAWLLIHVAIAGLLLVSLFGFGGLVGAYLKRLQTGLFGLVGYVVPFVYLYFAYMLLMVSDKKASRKKMTLILVLMISLASLIFLIVDESLTNADKIFEFYISNAPCGAIGGLFGGLVKNVVSRIGGFIVYLALAIFCSVQLTNKSLYDKIPTKGFQIRGVVDAWKQFREKMEERFLEDEDEEEIDYGIDTEDAYEGDYEPEFYEEASGIEEGVKPADITPSFGIREARQKAISQKAQREIRASRNKKVRGVNFRGLDIKPMTNTDAILESTKKAQSIAKSQGFAMDESLEVFGNVPFVRGGGYAGKNTGSQKQGVSGRTSRQNMTGNTRRVGWDDTNAKDSIRIHRDGMYDEDAKSGWKQKNGMHLQGESLTGYRLPFDESSITADMDLTRKEGFSTPEEAIQVQRTESFSGSIVKPREYDKAKLFEEEDDNLDEETIRKVKAILARRGEIVLTDSNDWDAAGEELDEGADGSLQDPVKADAKDFAQDAMKANVKSTGQNAKRADENGFAQDVENTNAEAKAYAENEDASSMDSGVDSAQSAALNDALYFEEEPEIVIQNVAGVGEDADMYDAFASHEMDLQDYDVDDGIVEDIFEEEDIFIAPIHSVVQGTSKSSAALTKQNANMNEFANADQYEDAVQYANADQYANVDQLGSEDPSKVLKPSSFRNRVGAMNGNGGKQNAPINHALHQSASSQNASTVNPLRKEVSSNSKKKGDAGVRVQREEIPYIFPPNSLLAKNPKQRGGFNDEEFRQTAMKLQQTLKNFGVNVTVTDISCGPVVTRYELQPEQGVKVNKIVSLSDDLKLSLAAKDIRIQAPIPGKPAVGIEVPNKESSIVYFRDLIETEEFKSDKHKIAFAIGRDIAGKPVVTDITSMPHLLIAGATGSGKSVCINTIIMSILYKYSPADVKLIMIDPKVVELSVYNGIPHLLIPVVTEAKKAAGALNWAVAEMTDRFKKFAEVNVRNIKGYNKKIEDAAKKVDASQLPEKMPNIVIVIDELADLMMVAQNEVESSICRIAQLARACGIHLVIATQRPSVNVITGLIKANIPTRIAFAVSSAIDSRTILDSGGAEKLLGKGDMLFNAPGGIEHIRIQGAFISDNEVQDVVEYVKNQGFEVKVDEETVTNIVNTINTFGDGNGSGDEDRDELFANVGRYIVKKKKASKGNLQIVFKIGFNRAARIMEQLFQAGVVGDDMGTKPREVLMSEAQFEELLESLGIS